MANSSWQRWLTFLMGSTVSRSRPRLRSPRVARIEILEGRTLLAAAPSVMDGFGSPQEDLAFPGTVATLATDLDSDPLTFSVVTSPTHGTLTLATNGPFTYTPSLNYNGPDSCQFKANVGTFALDVSAINDPLKVTLPSPNLQVSRTTSLVRLDPAAAVDDVDTVLNYGKTQIRTTIYTGNSATDNEKGRVVLKVRSEAPVAGAVTVKGSKIYVNGNMTTAVASFSGGSQGRSLIINFNSAATQADVNLVLKQISIQASKKATLGIRTLQMTVSAGGEKASAPKIVTVV